MPPDIEIGSVDDYEKELKKATFKDRPKEPSQKKKELVYCQERLAALIPALKASKLGREFKSIANGHLTKLQDKQSQLLESVQTELTYVQALAKTKARAVDREIKGKGWMGFINVGMGDCTLITTPKGRRIMIDCGSASMSDDADPTSIRDWVDSRKFLNGGSIIDLLFLTHPDGDHYNQLGNVLNPLNFKYFRKVYYGGTLNPKDVEQLDRDGLSQFHVGAVDGFLRATTGNLEDRVARVIFREEQNDKDKEKSITMRIGDKKIENGAGEEDAFGKEFIDPDTNAMVIYFEENFRISILAANVDGVWTEEEGPKRGNKRKMGDPIFVMDPTDVKAGGETKKSSTYTNNGSLMILVECFDYWTLVCGDGTALTEQFLVKYFSHYLTQVDMVRIGHHGSSTSSAEVFVKSLKVIQDVIVSTGGQDTTKHNLPEQGILNLFLKNGTIEDGTEAHDIYGFVYMGDENSVNEGKAAIKIFTGITQNLWSTGSNGTCDHIFLKPNSE